MRAATYQQLNMLIHWENTASGHRLQVPAVCPPGGHPGRGLPLPPQVLGSLGHRHQRSAGGMDESHVANGASPANGNICSANRLMLWSDEAF